MISKQVTISFGEISSAALSSPGELTKVLTKQERISHAYDELKLDELLHKFAFCKPVSNENPQIVDEDVAGDALLAYALHATYIATNDATAKLDVELMKGAFNHVYDSMDHAIETKLGKSSHAGVLSKLLAKTVKHDDAPVRHMARLDDRFWYEQLPDEMAAQTPIQRQAGDSDAGFAARCVYYALSTKVFSPFSYTPQAARFSC